MEISKPQSVAALVAGALTIAGSGSSPVDNSPRSQSQGSQVAPNSALSNSATSEKASLSSTHSSSTAKASPSDASLRLSQEQCPVGDCLSTTALVAWLFVLIDLVGLPMLVAYRRKHRAGPLSPRCDRGRVAQWRKAASSVNWRGQCAYLRRDGRLTLTVIIPAYNEGAHVADTVRSVQAQTLPAAEIVVVDDCSDDNTGDAALAQGAAVIRPPSNTGSKAGAQNFALSNYVDTELTMVLDADTILAPDVHEKLVSAFADTAVAAACTFVVPRHVRTLWERGRYTEYLYAFSFAKQVQDFFSRPLISSGCLSMYRTDALRAAGGWGVRTLAEDMDLTWTLYRRGWRVRFIAEAVCYPIEPRTYKLMFKQLKRWSHAFVQNVRLHWQDILKFPYLFTAVMVAYTDAVVASLVYLVGLPILALLISPLFLLGYIIDAPVILIPILVAAVRRRELIQAITSFPAFFILRLLNGWLLLGAVWTELILRRPFLVYEKGH